MRKMFTSILKNKKTLFLILGVGLILTFIPFQSARADWISDLIDGILAIPVAIFELPVTLAINSALAIALFFLVIIFNLFSGFLASAFALAVALTEWLIDTSINIGVIPGAAPGIVETGWQFTLGFVNMLFILILSFYGLATILRIREYDLKKTLPKVLAIAILVNFTPVIVGLIVDAGNITTDFFMQKALDADIINIVLGNESAGTGIWGRVVKPAIDNAMGAIFGNLFADPSTTIGLFVQAVGPLVVAIVFLILACLIFLMVAFVFLMRIVMLWILMILAPIAFFSYVIPEKAAITSLFPDILLWRKWWEEFIKWVIVGIPFGLFLYISSWMLENSNDILLSGSTYEPSGLTFTIGSMTLDIRPLFDSILTVIPFIVPLAVLYVGYQISTKAAPSAARGIISGVTGAAKTGAMMVATGGAAAVGATVGGAMAGGAAAGVSGVSSRLQSAEAWVGRRPGGRLFKQALKPFTGAARGAEKVLVPRLRKAEAEMKKVEVAKGFSDLKPEAQKDVAKGQLTAQSRLAHYAKMKSSDLSKSLEKDERLKAGVIRDVQKLAGDKDYEEQVKKVAKVLPEAINENVALKLGIKKEDVDKAKEDLDKQLEDTKLEAEIKMKYDIAEDKDISEEIKRSVAAASVHASRLSSKDVSELSDTSLKSLPVRLGSKHWTGSHLAKVKDNFGKDTVQDFFEKPGGINTLNADDLYKKNKRLARFLVASPTGREWGWGGRQELVKRGYTSKDRDDFLRPNFDKYEKAMMGKEEAEKFAPETPAAPAVPLHIEERDIKKRASQIINQYDPDKLRKIRTRLDDLGITDPSEGGDYIASLAQGEAIKQLIGEREEQIKKLMKASPSVEKIGGSIPKIHQKRLSERRGREKEVISAITEKINSFKTVNKEIKGLEEDMLRFNKTLDDWLEGKLDLTRRGRTEIKQKIRETETEILKKSKDQEEFTDYIRTYKARLDTVQTDIKNRQDRIRQERLRKRKRRSP